MAAGKLSPRQKMIGMMYLVLTALLALNVSKEILDSFVTVNTGLENTGNSFDKDINSLYAKFDEKKSIDPLRVITNWKKAQEARKLSKEMSNFIVNLKRLLLRETEGLENKEEDTLQLQYVKNKDNYDIPTNILCGDSEDGTNGQAHELKLKLEQFEKNMIGLLSPQLQKEMHLTIETDDPKGDAEYKTWEMKTFYHAPLAADITLLSKIADDVKAAEADIVDALLRETDSDIIPFDTVAARVIAQTNYVMQGEPYQADIFLAAFNKTLSPQIYVGDYDPKTGKMVGTYDSVAVSNGLGRYMINTSKEGIMTYEGVINMKTPKGVIMQYPFRSEYIVARPSANVSADKMNVMYAGLDNPITASAPGVPTDKMRVTCDNGTLVPQGNGKYIVKNPTPGRMCHITVVAEGDSGKTRQMGVIEFTVKYLPIPIVYPSGVTTSRPAASALFNCLGLVCKYDQSFQFQAKANVKSYSLDITDKTGFLYSKETILGNQIPTDAKNIMRGLRRGAKVTFYNISAVGADGRAVTTGDLTYTIQ
jgi:gliding motility-associated protein GldM